VSKYRQGENPARWRGHLQNLLANSNKIAPVKNDPSLPCLELPEFMALLALCEAVAVVATRFAILPAARSGEVRVAKWAEIDLPARLWTVPAVRMKAGKEHRVPQSTAAMAIIESMTRKDELIFQGRRPDTMLSDMNLTAVLRRLDRSDTPCTAFARRFAIGARRLRVTRSRAKFVNTR